MFLSLRAVSAIIEELLRGSQQCVLKRFAVPFSAVTTLVAKYPFASFGCSHVTGSSVCMQAKRDPSNPAKGITQLEFCERARDMKGNTITSVKARLSPAEAAKVLKHLRFSFDNGAFHQCADLLMEIAGISPSQRAPLPPWGPDFNQPAEHGHGRFKSKMRELINGGWWPENMTECWAMCEKVWEEVNGEEVVSADVERLPALYEHVACVSKGDWAPPYLS